MILKVNGTDVHRFSTKEGKLRRKTKSLILTYGLRYRCSAKMLTPRKRSCHIGTETR